MLLVSDPSRVTFLDSFFLVSSIKKNVENCSKSSGCRHGYNERLSGEGSFSFSYMRVESF